MTRPTPRTAGIVTFLALAAACSVGSRLPRHARGATALWVRGAVKGGPFQLGDADLAALPQRIVRGVAPGAASAEPVRYAGVDLGALVTDEVELTGDADTVVFHTADLMAVSVPVSVLLQLRPVLAARADDVPLPARLVAWPTEAQPGLTSDPRAPVWWARGVTALEVVSAARTLGRALHVPEAAPAGARAGAALFEARCLACHRVRSGGGLRGPELTRVAERLSPEALRRKLQGHPGWDLPGQAEPTAQAAAQLDAFLRTVAAYTTLSGARQPDEVGDDPAEPEPLPPIKQKEPAS